MLGHALLGGSWLASRLQVSGAAAGTKPETCQTCHGEVAAHLDDPDAAKPTHLFNDKSMLAPEKSAVCLSCHDGNRQLAFWESGKHRKNDVACSDCHSIHGKVSDPSITPYLTTQRKLEYETCGECHKSIRAQLNKNSHHPILEGKVACSDCHNPHGALSPAMVMIEAGAFGMLRLKSCSATVSRRAPAALRPR